MSTGPKPETTLLDALAAPSPTPGGGSAAAHVGAVAAALARMVAGITVGKAAHAERAPRMRDLATRAEMLRRQLSALVARDADVFAGVSLAARLPREPAEAAVARRRAMDDALRQAAEVPLETARVCAEAAALCAELVTEGHRPAAADAAVGALLAEAACRGAALDVRVNVRATSDPALHADLVAEAEALAARAAASREDALRGAELD